MIRSEAILGLPGYQVTGIEERNGRVKLSARYSGPIACPHCGGQRLRNKGRRIRKLRHESWGTRHAVLELETHKWHCRECGRYFWQRCAGILPRKRATEPYRRSVSLRHWDGISRSRLGRREGLASATVDFERNTYLLHQHTRYGQDFDRYRMIRQEASSLAAQARRSLTQYALSKLKLSSKGSPYGLSIARALQSFYAGLGRTIDPRLSPELGRDLTKLCVKIGQMGAGEPAGFQAAVPFPPGEALELAPESPT